MLLPIYFVLICIGVFIRTGRLYRVSVIVFLASLVAINTSHSDYLAYKTAYEGLYGSSVFVTFEPGYQFLCVAGNNLGLSYNAFAFILTLVALALLDYVSLHLAKNNGLVLALYLIYPALINLVQFRQFLAMACIALSVYLLSKETGRAFAGSIASLAIACLLHFSSIVFVAIYAIRAFLSRPKYLYIGLGALFGFFTLGSILAYDFISQLFGADKVTVYFSGYTGYTSLSAKIATSLIVLSMALLSRRSMTHFIQSDRMDMASGAMAKRKCCIAFCKYAYYLNLMSIALIPLFTVNTTIMRIHRVVIFLTAVSFAIAYDQEDRSFVDYVRLVLVLIIYLASELFYVVLPSFDDVIASLLLVT